MDSSAAPRRSRHLAGLSHSTSPPPLEERNRQSRQTTSHIDSHMMGDHEDEIPELSSPPHEVGEEDPMPIYDPSPNIPTHSGYDPSHDIPTHSRYDPSSELAELGLAISKIGTFHDRPTHSKVDSPLTHYRRMPRLILNTRELLMVAMVCLVLPHMIWHFMSNLSSSLTLCLGTLSFLTIRRGLGEQVTLHLPSWWWK